jgi:uncharacterized glyoxalase superfamily protein PhnB
MVAKIPEGYNSVIPTLVINGAAKAIDLYKKAFGAQEVYRMEGDKGKIMHACIAIGSSKLFVCDTNPEMGCAEPSSSTFYAYFDNVDTTFTSAKGAGLKELSPVQDMFWGDRTGNLEDSFGIRWTLATHVKDVSPEEMEKGRKEFASRKAA